MTHLKDESNEINHRIDELSSLQKELASVGVYSDALNSLVERLHVLRNEVSDRLQQANREPSGDKVMRQQNLERY